MGGMCVALELWSFETDNVPVPVANKLPEQQIADASMHSSGLQLKLMNRSRALTGKLNQQQPPSV